MVWKALLYTTGIGVGVYIILLSRQLVSIKRWYDLSFLQGAGLIAWGLAHLMANHPNLLIQQISLPLDMLYYLFFLMSLHAYPLAPHIYYDRWKSILDAMAFVAVYGTTALCSWLYQEEAGILIVLLHILSGFLLLAPWTTVFMANGFVNGRQEKETRLLVATLLFTLVVMFQPIMPTVFFVITGSLSVSFLLLAHTHFPRNGSKARLMNEYGYLHEQLRFSFLDSNSMQVLLLVEVIAMFTWTEPRIHLIGIGIGFLITVFRLFLTKTWNQSLVRQMMSTASNLEKKFTEHVEQIQRKNDQLSQILAVKQTYEKILLASNEQSLREVSYENLQQVIEELVDVWFAKLDNLVYLRISLESTEGVVYYEVVRGDPNHPYIHRDISEQIVVDEQLDTPLAPRYVVMLAKSTTESIEELELEQSIFQLLIVNVRGLILRCLQENQLLELRLMEQEMELAQRIQFLLIPRERLVLPYLQAKAVFLPYTYVGGDYVDYLVLDDRFTCFVVADVSGHGLPASLMTTGIRSAVRAVTQTFWRPDLILHQLNKLLYEDLIKTRSFITMLIAVYDSADHTLSISRAGHPQPIFWNSTGARLLSCSGGLGLGLLPDSVYVSDEVPLDQDGMLLAYTDGLLEMSRKDSQQCLQTWLKGLSSLLGESGRPGDLDSIEVVENYVRERTREGLQSDDISLLILRFQSGTEQEEVHDDVV
ncbi:PP2C family protein-serine/threonine phosphatase [Brevibacillus borstelensis]|uniref:PP2C family protein-serine/threonine phosphatase n=1 Tax=Brevibacillus borstelensis TaxID=45462 RepID=UPI0030C626A1